MTYTLNKRLFILIIDILFLVGHAAMYGMILESRKPLPSTQRTNLGLHVVQHTKVSKKAKTVNGGTNNVKNPHKGKSSAITNSIKSSSLIMAALSHLIPAIILVGCFF
jgi:hypothetical protein